MDFDPVIDSALGCLGAPEVVPDTILPAQFFPRAAALAPERRLIMAVLARSSRDLQSNAGTGTRRARRHLAEVEAWLASDDDGWPFSFMNLCHVLDLDLSSVRSGHMRWRRVARAHVVGLRVRGSAAARPAADQARGLPCAG